MAGLIATPTLAQPKQDFSGTWISAGSSEQNFRVQKIVHRDPKLSLHSALVFVTVLKDGYRVVVTREVWSISNNGKQLTKATRVIDMDGVTESTHTFVRQ